jgi:hypothetical protein
VRNSSLQRHKKREEAKGVLTRGDSGQQGYRFCPVTKNGCNGNSNSMGASLGQGGAKIEKVESQGQWARSLAPFIASGAARDEQPPAGSGALKPTVLETERGKGRRQDGSRFCEGKGSGDSLLSGRR